MTNLLPYDPASWSRLCFDGTTGALIEPQPLPANAQQALDSMPTGTKWRLLKLGVPNAGDPFTATQSVDTSQGNRFGLMRQAWPCLWGRQDSTAALSDLSSYTRLLHLDRIEVLDKDALASIEVVLLVTPTNQPLQAAELPPLMRRA